MAQSTPPIRVGDRDVVTYGARRFEDRVAVVTGAGSGIGRAVTERLLAEGARVYALDLSAEALTSVWSGVPGAIAVQVDVADSASVAAAFALAEAESGAIDVLVTAAGIADAPWRAGADGSADLPTIDDAAWALVVGVNLTGTFYCMRAAIPLLRRNGERGGSIVTISSVGAIAPHPLPGGYAASKAGVLGLTRATAAFYAADNIRINAIAPAATATPMLPVDEEMRAWIVGSQPLARIASAAEMAGSIVWLASDEAAYFTGQTISPNGGVVM
jgi:3-oxoacyl-[acyl-carrier protein] reductase